MPSTIPLSFTLTLYGSIVLLLLCLLLLVLLIKAHTKVKRANTTLARQKLEVEAQHRAIQQQKQVLEELNEVKNKMFSIIAHDFRSPLNTIQGVLSLLHVNALSEQELYTLLPDLTRKVDASINLLDNLLHWSRAQMDGVRINPRSFSIKKIVEETIAQMHQLSQQKDILIQAFIGDELYAYADPEMIRLVIRNLLSNAIKFSYEGHAIHVEVGEEDGQVVVSVTDFGVGIPPDIQADLFSYRGYTTKGTAQEKGTGLGLNLCQECVTQNRGKIWLRSQPHQQTTFSFSVPLAKTHQLLPRASSATAG